MAANLVAVSGNTYPVRDQLRAMGGQWDKAARAWMMPEAQAEAARAIVDGAGPVAPRSFGRSSYRPRYRSDAFTGRNAGRYGGRCNCEDYPCCGH